MVFWILFFIGTVIFGVTGQLIDFTVFECNLLLPFYGGWDSVEKNKKIIIYLLLTLSIMLSDGMATSLLVYTSSPYKWFWQLIMGIVWGGIMAWMKYHIYKLYIIADRRLNIYFAIIYIVSTLVWTIFLNVYGQNVFEVFGIVFCLK